MAKRNSPALYELIRHRGGERVPAARSEADSEAPAPIMPSGSWLQPGRSIALPVGYVFVALALVVGLLIMTFAIGFERGRQAERTIFQEDAGLLATGNRNAPLQDPLARNDSPTSPARVGGDSSPRPRNAGTAAPSASPSDWGPVRSDPRERGHWYFVLAETRETGAVRIAEFFRNHGLETYVVSGHNPNLRRVVVLPGFESEQRNSREARSLREQIRSVGGSWSQEGLGQWQYDEYLSQY